MARLRRQQGIMDHESPYQRALRENLRGHPPTLSLLRPVSTYAFSHDSHLERLRGRHRYRIGHSKMHRGPDRTARKWILKWLLLPWTTSLRPRPRSGLDFFSFCLDAYVPTTSSR